jgi:hypothetical protein
MPAISESAPTAHTPERRKGGGGKGSGGGGKGGGGSGGGGGKSGGGGGGSSSSGGKQDYGGSLASAHPSRIQGPARQRPSRAATRRRGRRKPSDSARALALVRACMHHRTALAAAGSTPLGPVHPTRAGSTEARRGRVCVGATSGDSWADRYAGLDLWDIQVLERIPIRLLWVLHGLVGVPIRLLAGADPQPLLLRVTMR